MIGGSYKNSDNEIVEELAHGTRRVRFQPVPAWETADCGLSKPDRVREIVKNSLGKITETETVVKCPDINERERQRALKNVYLTAAVTYITDALLQ